MTKLNLTLKGTETPIDVKILCLYNDVRQISPIMDPILKYPVVGRCLVQYSAYEGAIKVQRGHNVYRDDEKYFIDVFDHIIPIEDISPIPIKHLEGEIPTYSANNCIKYFN